MKWGVWTFFCPSDVATVKLVILIVNISYFSEHLICTGYDEIVVGGCASGRYKDCANSVAHSITCCKSGLSIRQVFKLRL